MEPFISIIVPVRNMERTIGKTFQYLMKADYPRSKMEIIFSDGGSSDKTVSVIREYQKEHPFIKLIQIPNCPSPGFARTKALQEAKGEFIFFTDGDCAPCSDWIYKILEVFNKEHKIGAVGGEIYTLRVDPGNLVEIYSEAFGFNRVSWRYGNLEESYYPDLHDLRPTEVCGHKAYFFVTANVAYRKETVEENERRFWDLPTGEDIDFGIRARKNGWKFYFLPSASVEHMHRADLKALHKVWHSYGQAHPPLLNAHAKRCMEIIFQFMGKYPNHFILRFPCFLKSFVYIGNFHLMHLFGIFFTIFFILQWMFPFSFWIRFFAWMNLPLFGFFTFRFFRTAFNIEPYHKWFPFAKMKYLTNLYFILGGLKGSFKHKTLCIEPSF
ncbi:MAG: glycosyltransferase [Candidatus Omnitrophota bacterium]|nr:MAG: glycosyltransferase [Candidatus Omnitrophota bacterium]